ncbi:helicase-exonuclease AddAB subunit AddA [Paenibacillaceae bacterium]|nr:helicase-exonuclease AddAB subunit AddA [Paenibacillaceae bacterium]
MGLITKGGTVAVTEFEALTKKPSDSNWTDEQWQAIVSGGRDILVAAAAGSGKTAVLVERIIRKISNETDVDRLLVATFTKAAASEMKERIRIALERALDADPGSEHLRRQLALMNRASITTLHSFCLDVIRRYYPLIGLDPGFRIANETEAELMRLDVLDALFEQRYAEAAAAVEAGEEESSFIQLADDFGGERSDEPLYRLVQRLYDFSNSHPWPEYWLRETAAAFTAPDEAALEGTQWVRMLVADVQLTLGGAQTMLQQALAKTGLPGGPDSYGQTLTEDLGMLEGLIDATSRLPWREWRSAFAGAAFGKLKALRGDGYDKGLQDETKALREQAKEMINDLKEELFQRSTADFLFEMNALAPRMAALAELVIDFGSRYERAKRSKGLLDFGDLEHYCLRILRAPTSTPLSEQPSAAAHAYREQFDEILLDEYQDTNRVQEAIVSLIAREAGNRFMVGDVKQSIYRFRLAEPNLFLQKYHSFNGSEGVGLRIDLARNFRSRLEVVDGVNDVFRAIMHEKVAEMEYDERAELVCGASYPAAERMGGKERYAVEFALLNRGGSSPEEREDDQDALDGDVSNPGSPKADAADLQTAELEGRWIAAQIHELFNPQGGAVGRFRVYDSKAGAHRPLEWRDIVILLRATQQWAPIVIAELQALGIPAYAELNSGYFDATEVEIMISLLRVIDNPLQDIPLAGVLRSPIFGLTAEDLALVRIHADKGSFYDAVLQAAGSLLQTPEVRAKLMRFLEQLGRWREEARQGSLSDLLWQIYRETGYFDLVGGLPGGVQRQANLRALHDRARQYEATSFRGLFRFLRFIDRMRENGGDLGTARALGEQENVVRIMSIHKSKGLEFPVVFVAGLGKMFNMQDLNSPFLMHKELGFGPRYVDSSLRVSYPTLPYLAIRRRMRMEMLAEEMRILYVALTRPKEKLFLVATSTNAEKQLHRWQSAVVDGRMPDFTAASARRFADWLLPLVASGKAFDIAAMIGHMDVLAGKAMPSVTAGDEANDLVENLTAEDEAAGLGDEAEARHNTDHSPLRDSVLKDWKFTVPPAELFVPLAAAAVEADPAAEEARERILGEIQKLAPLATGLDETAEQQIDSRLSWRYPYAQAPFIAAKTSVTEMKRMHAEAGIEQALTLEEASAGAMVDSTGISYANDSELAADGRAAPAVSADAVTGLAKKDKLQMVGLTDVAAESAKGLPTGSLRLRRPRFMEEISLTAAERGTVSHLLMQHVPLEGEVDGERLQAAVQNMIDRSLLTVEQSEAIDLTAVESFFASELGARLLRAPWKRREVPFSCTLPAERVHQAAAASAISGEPVLIQGIIDCLFEDEDGLVLVDYKTDVIRQGQWRQSAERHRFQLELYAEAIGRILGKTVDECYVFFFDGGKAIRLR